MGMNCPVCKTTELQPFQVGNDAIDKCPSCHGLWFNAEELGDVEEMPDTELMNDFQDQLDDANVTQKEATVKDYSCPQCNKPMSRYQYDVSSGIWIHGCPKGDGVWLDRGEVLKIHQHLQDAAKALPPEKLKSLQAQLKQIDADEKKKELEAIDSLFNHQKGSKYTLPAWHAMDGVCRIVFHFLNRIGV